MNENIIYDHRDDIVDDMHEKKPKMDPEEYGTKDNNEDALIENFFTHFSVNEEAVYSPENCYPVYIILQHTGANIISKSVRALKHAEYTHVSISFTHTLDPLYTFGAKPQGKWDKAATKGSGFVIDNPTGPYWMSHPQTVYGIYVMFVNAKAYKAMIKMVDSFIATADLWRYDFLSLIPAFFNIKTEKSNKLFCSKFVAYVINAGYKLDKVPSLWQPNDFQFLDNVSLVNRGQNFTLYDASITERNVNLIRSGNTSLIKLPTINANATKMMKGVKATKKPVSYTLKSRFDPVPVLASATIQQEDTSEDLTLPDTRIASTTPKPDVNTILDNTDPNHIYLTSDWHLFIEKYKSDKQYVNRRKIIKWCKDHIKPNDVFLYLGDCCYRHANQEDSYEAQRLFKSLPGIKILVLGNHDKEQGEPFYSNLGFDYVVEEIHWHNIIFTHQPINMDIHQGEINIHGHRHNEHGYNTITDPSANMNVFPIFYHDHPTTLQYMITHIKELTKNNYWKGILNIGESATVGESKEDIINSNEALLAEFYPSFIDKYAVSDTVWTMQEATIASVSRVFSEETHDFTKYRNNYKPTQTMHLADLTKPVIDKAYLNSHEWLQKDLKHEDIKFGRDIIDIWTDDKDKPVVKLYLDCRGYPGVKRWIALITIDKKYRGMGLGKEVLDYAVKHEKGTALGVHKDNKVAFEMYKKYGFKLSPESKKDVDDGKSEYYAMYLGKIPTNQHLESYMSDIYNLSNNMIGVKYHCKKICAEPLLTTPEKLIAITKYLAINNIDYRIYVVGYDSGSYDDLITAIIFDLDGYANYIDISNGDIYVGNNDGDIIAFILNTIKAKNPKKRMDNYKKFMLRKPIPEELLSMTDEDAYNRYVLLYCHTSTKDNIYRGPVDMKINALPNLSSMDGSFAEASLKSNIDADFKAKGHIKLSELFGHKVDKKIIDHYKDKYRFFKHCDPNDEAYYWSDVKDNVVCILAVDHSKEDGRHWITVLEVAKEYRGYGLGKELLDYAVKNMHADALSVNKDNQVAIAMYKKYGFSIYPDSKKAVNAGKFKQYLMYLGKMPTPVKETVLINIPDMNNHNESNTTMLTEEAEYSPINCYPVFICLNHFNGNVLSFATRATMGAKYTHAAISFTPTLEPMYSFGLRDKDVSQDKLLDIMPILRSGFIVTSPHGNYFSMDRHKTVEYAVYVMYVNKEQLEAMQTVVDHFIKTNRIRRYEYDFGALTVLPFGIETEKSKRWFCSKFTAAVISAGVKLNKPNSLWLPDHFRTQLNNITCVNKGINFDKYDPSITLQNLEYVKRGEYDKIKFNKIYREDAINEACKDLATARRFVWDVGKLAKKYNANYFIVTDGASGTSNGNGGVSNSAVKNARLAQIEWEKNNGGDPDEDWSDTMKEAKYDPPYNSQQVLNKYGKEVHDRLSQDPAHKYRMDTGIELIHQEPSLDELERIYANWQLMSLDQKKQSDEMSKRLYGVGNEDHYKQLLQLYNENLIFSTKDVSYNKKEFENGDVNLAIVVGFSGSGKTTMGKSLARKFDNCDHIELDDISTPYNFTDEQLKEYSDMVFDFFRGLGLKYRVTIRWLTDNNISDKEYEIPLIKDFIAFAIDYANKHKYKRYVLEGIWPLVYNIPPVTFKDCAVYIKGTSYLVSYIRAAVRDSKSDYIFDADGGVIEEKKNGFFKSALLTIRNLIIRLSPNIIKNYAIGLNNTMNAYIKYFNKSKEYVTRESYLYEAKRSDLPDSAFGIPEDRKFPLDTEQHVKSAIRLFGHASEEKKKSLAHRIAAAAKKYDIKIPETTQCYKYLHEEVSTPDYSNADNTILVNYNDKVVNFPISYISQWALVENKNDNVSTYYITLNEAVMNKINSLITSGYFTSNISIEEYVFITSTMNGSTPICIGKIELFEAGGYEWNIQYPIKIRDKAIIPMREYSAAAMNPVIGIHRPFILTTDYPNAKVVFTNDIENNRALVVSKQGSLEVQPIDTNRITGIYEFVGDYAFIRRLEKMYRENTHINSNLYTILTGKTLYSEDQIDFDPSFKKVDIDFMEEEAMSSIATFNSKLMEVVYGESYVKPISNDSLPKWANHYNQFGDISIREDFDGYFFYNSTIDKRTQSVKYKDMLSEVMIKTII